MSGQLHTPTALPSSKNTGSCWKGSWLDVRGTFGEEKISCPTEIRNTSLPARGIVTLPLCKEPRTQGYAEASSWSNETLCVRSFKVDGNSIEDIETKLCVGRSGFGFDWGSKLPVQPTQPPVQGVRLLSPPLRGTGRETDHCHNLLKRLRMSGAIPTLPYAFMMCTGSYLTVSNQTTYIFFSRRLPQCSKST